MDESRPLSVADSTLCGRRGGQALEPAVGSHPPAGYGREGAALSQGNLCRGSPPDGTDLGVPPTGSDPGTGPNNPSDRSAGTPGSTAPSAGEGGNQNPGGGTGDDDDDGDNHHCPIAFVLYGFCYDSIRPTGWRPIRRRMLLNEPTSLQFLTGLVASLLVAMVMLVTVGVVYHKTSTWRSVRPYTTLAVGLPLLLLTAVGMRLSWWWVLLATLGAGAIGWLWGTFGRE